MHFLVSLPVRMLNCESDLNQIRRMIPLALERVHFWSLRNISLCLITSCFVCLLNFGELRNFFWNFSWKIAKPFSSLLKKKKRRKHKVCHHAGGVPSFVLCNSDLSTSSPWPYILQGVRILGTFDNEIPRSFLFLEDVVAPKTLISDIDECAQENGGCKQLCINLPGSYQCSCKAGFLMIYDGKTCEGLSLRLILSRR